MKTTTEEVMRDIEIGEQTVPTLCRAVFDGPKRFRLMLRREFYSVRGESRVMVCMLNPSTAGAEKDDATIRVLMKYIFRMRRRELIVVNLSPLISTDPTNLRYDLNLNGEREAYEESFKRIREHFVLWGPDLTVIAAWGANAYGSPTLVDRMVAFKKVVWERRMRLHAFATTRKGYPWHPLRKRLPLTLEDFR